MVCELIVLFFVSLELLFLGTLYATTDFLVFIFKVEVALDHEKILPGFNLLGIYRVKIAFTKTKVMDGIKQVCLALPVVSRNAVDLSAEAEIGLTDIFEIGN